MVDTKIDFWVKYLDADVNEKDNMLTKLLLGMGEDMSKIEISMLLAYFSDLADTAHQKGYEKGWNDAVDAIMG